MINAIAELGNYCLQKKPEMDLLDMVLDDAYDQGKNKHLLSIIFSQENSSSADWQFKTVEYRQLDQTYRKKILYKYGSPNGTDFTPTAKITELEAKTFPNKILNWFNQNKNNALLNQEEQQLLNSLQSVLEQQQAIILTQIKEKIAEINDPAGQVLTIALQAGSGELNFIGHYELFRKFLTEQAVLNFKYSKTNNAYSFSQDQLCSVCNIQQSEVFGFFTDLKFYTVDKAGMITSGFQHEDAWKNYPVCLNCALNVRNGYDYLKQYFNFNFYGLHYLFIPKSSDAKLYPDLLEALMSYRNQRFKSEDINRITNDEDEIFKFLQEERTTLSFDLFFYDTPQKSVLRILLSIQDVLPSRIRKLFSLKKQLDDLIFFKNALSKENQPLCFFNFGIIRNFFPNLKMEGNFDKHFLEITDKVFKSRSIDRIFILRAIMNKVKRRFVNNESTWLDTLKGFMFLLFVHNHQNTEVIMDPQFFKDFKIQTRDEFEPKVQQFFENFQDFFQTSAQQAIFLLGTLSQYLLNIQKRDRNATPFRAKLKGLKMTAYDLSVLLPEIIEKLEQYEKNYYRPQEEMVSKLLLAAGNYKNWRLPVDEMNFIFVLGMNLSNYFKIKTQEEKENTNV